MMKINGNGWFSLMLITVLSGCHWSGDRLLGSTSHALLEAASMCLYDVRDRQLTYELSHSCTSLGGLAEEFIEAGGFVNETPDKYKIIGAEARATAWMARATSMRGGGPVRIW
jgi:hypothetical protein